MPALRPRPIAALAALLALAGCASLNDRYPSGYDPVLRLLGAEPNAQRDWPSRAVPDLPALQTEMLPERRPPPADPPVGWPPLSPSVEPASLSGLPRTESDSLTVAPRAIPAPDPASRGHVSLLR